MINASEKFKVGSKEYSNLEELVKGKNFMDGFSSVIESRHGTFRLFDKEIEIFLNDLKDLERVCKTNRYILSANDPVFDVNKHVFLTTPERFKEDADHSNWTVGSGWAVPYSYSSDDNRIIYFVNVDNGGSEFLVIFRDCDSFMKIWDVFSADRMSLDEIFEQVRIFIEEDKKEQKMYRLESYHEVYQVHNVPAKDLESALKQLEKSGLDFKVSEKDYISDSFQVDKFNLEDNYEEEFEVLEKEGKLDSFEFEIK